MKYELVASFQPHVIVPEWAPGVDRLDYIGPNPEDLEITLRSIANGSISRYVEHDDHVERFEDRVVVHTIFNKREAAEFRLTYWNKYPEFISIELIERPDL